MNKKVYTYNDNTQFTDFIVSMPYAPNDRNLSNSFIEKFTSTNYVFLDNQQFTDYNIRRPYIEKVFNHPEEEEKRITDYIFIDNRYDTNYTFRNKNGKSCAK